MRRNDDLFSPEGIDEQIEQRRPAHSQPTPGDQLMHDLHEVARSKQQLYSRSLERVWQQVQARREQGTISAQNNEHNLQATWKQPEGKIIDIKKKEAMEGNNIP